LLKDVNVGTTIGGTGRPVEVQANGTVGGGERPVRLEVDGTILDKVNASVHADLAANTSAQLTTDLLDKIAARLATPLDGKVLDKINATVGLSASIKELAPFILTLLWTEIPIVKLRFPHNYTFGFSLFGFEFFALHFRGETKAVTAKNPNGAAGNV